MRTKSVDIDADLIIQSLEEEHDGAGAVVGGEGGGPQLVDVAAVVHVDGPRLIGIQRHDGLWRSIRRRDNSLLQFHFKYWKSLTVLQTQFYSTESMRKIQKYNLLLPFPGIKDISSGQIVSLSESSRACC